MRPLASARASSRRAFETLHPSVVAAYAFAVTATTMCALHPVFAAVSLTGALTCSLVLCGTGRTLATLRWNLPLFVLVCLTNPLLSRRGDTLVWQGSFLSISLESVTFGLCMGMLLLSSLLWLWCLGQVLTLDRLVSLGGGLLPTIGLMISMVMRLVPQLVRRGDQVRLARAACSAAPSGEGLVGQGARLSGILLTWSLEDSIERSDAMRARGWTSSARRSSYVSWRFTSRDVLCLAAVLALALVDAFLEWVACSQWDFYPTMPHLVAWWGYLPHVVLVLVPAVIILADRLSWTLAERR